MRVRFAFRGVEKVLRLDISNWEMSLADLVEEALGFRPARRVWVDSRAFDPTTPIEEVALLDGATVSDEERPIAKLYDGWTIRVSGGADLGLPQPLREGKAVVVGRAPDVDLHIDSPSTSWAHASFRVEGGALRVSDLGSSNGTYIGNQRVSEEGMVLGKGSTTVVVGGAAVTVSYQDDEPRAPAPGSLPNITAVRTVPFNRPPRPGMRPGPKPVTPPKKKEPTKPSNFSWAAIFSPLILAGAMVLIMGNPRFALFALLSPVIALGTYFENKRRFKRESVGEEERYANALDEFREAIRLAGDEERDRALEVAPDPGVSLIRSSLPSTRMWQRRVGTPDFLSLHVGLGSQPWNPPLDRNAGSQHEDEVDEILEAATIDNFPIEVDLKDGGVVGIYGDREASLSLARSLLAQAATHLGPADMSIGIFADSRNADEWDWAGWLPHTRFDDGSQGRQWISFDTRRSERMLSQLRDSIDGQIAESFLLVIDSDILLEGRESVVRDLLGHGRRRLGDSSPRTKTVPVSGIVLAESEDQLPSSCTSVVEVGQDSAAVVKRPEIRETIDNVLMAGLTEESAQYVAQNLAHFDDPELKLPGATLPGMAHMLPLLELGELSPDSILKQWRTTRGYNTPVGVSEAGTYSLDLVRDGPHGLVGGTTGSGKSEFLRTFVAGLAARIDPEHLTFILIDFKGGAAFGACNELPHTIGTISNLDEQLAMRALKALEAEMEYRQKKFAAAGEGVDNLDAYLATNPPEPMPRLLLVIDEFAQLAKDFPDVLTSIVSVAAVGRTLGVHMILATQRPAGVVNDDILANTNMRVALRVQSREDSTNVIGVPVASSISREQRGRAYVKLGEDDISPIQTALITGYSDHVDEAAIEIDEVVVGTDPAQRAPAKPPKGTPNDLDCLIDTIVEANEKAGFAPPRPVWPEALGERVNLELDSLPVPDEARVHDGKPVPSSGGIVDDKIMVAVADDPDNQRQFRDGWDTREGNVLIMGVPGSGTTTALTSLALVAADTLGPDELDIFVIDMGASSDLAALQQLPHMGGFAGSGAGGSELLGRLVTFMRKEMARRKANPGEHRKALILVDGLAAMRDEYQDGEGMALLENFYRVYADGPSVGMYFAVTTTRAKAVPSQMEDVTTQRWLLRLADPYDYSIAGIRGPDIPAPDPGRSVFSSTKLQTHIATPPLGVSAAAAAIRDKWDHLPTKQPIIALLQDRVWVDELKGKGSVVGEPWQVPIGIAEADLRPMSVALYQGEHMLIAGPVRSGKSSVLIGIGESLRAAAREQGQPLEVWALGGRRSPVHQTDFDRVADTDDAAEFLVSARVQTVPTVILIDDAEQFDDSDGLITQLIQNAGPDTHIVAAGRADDLRTMYAHWTKTIRRARCGGLLQPNVDYDGELLGVRLPRRAPVEMRPGRGYAVQGGIAQLVQAATADIESERSE